MLFFALNLLGVASLYPIGLVSAIPTSQTTGLSSTTDQSQSSASPITTANLLGAYKSPPGVECYAHSTGIFSMDCTRAIAQFPHQQSDDPFPGTFYRNNTEGRWNLPQLRLVGSCLAIVDMSGVLPTEQSSWAEINSALGLVFRSCVASNCAGKRSIGELNGITVSLQSGRSPRPAVEGHNLADKPIAVS